jgi:hypothetical protein
MPLGGGQGDDSTKNAARDGGDAGPDRTGGPPGTNPGSR